MIEVNKFKIISRITGSIDAIAQFIDIIKRNDDGFTVSFKAPVKLDHNIIIDFLKIYSDITITIDDYNAIIQ